MQQETLNQNQKVIVLGMFKIVIGQVVSKWKEEMPKIMVPN